MMVHLLFLLIWENGQKQWILLSFAERDAFDTLLDHAPDKLNVVKMVRTGFVWDKNFCAMELIRQK